MPDDPYDQQPYTDHAYAESHPDRLAVVARLSGWEPTALDHARVLELGCGRGGNLLPMAAGLPGATLVGVDRSTTQVSEACRVARETGLANVTFRRGSFDEVDLPAAAFDFVICHGVYSWVPPDTRRSMLRSIGAWLAPGGIAYVSFNTLPGWYRRLAARDWLRFCTDPEGLGQPPSAAAPSLDWLSGQVSPELDGYRRELAQVGKRLEETDPAYLIHEYLAEEHHPEAVGTFLAEAEAGGLSYLGDAVPAGVAVDLLPTAVAERAEGKSVATTQGLVDFVRCTAFRRALLVRADDARDRGWRWLSRLDARSMESLRVASRLRPLEPARLDFWAGPEGGVQVEDDGTRRALQELARVAPRSLGWGDLVERARAGPAMREELFDVWLATGGLDLHTCEPRFTAVPGERPKACPVARWQAAHGGTITNRWHHGVHLPDAPVRRVLGMLDGTRSVADLVRETGEQAALVRTALDLLAGSALLVD